MYARRLEHTNMHTDVYSVGLKRRNKIPVFLGKKTRKAEPFYMAFFHSREKSGFPFWPEGSSGIFGLSGTMESLPTSSQLIQPTLCKIWYRSSKWLPD